MHSISSQLQHQATYQTQTQTQQTQQTQLVVIGQQQYMAILQPQQSQQFHRPLISYPPEACGALTDAQANKSSDSQSEDATPERLETVIKRTAPQSKRLRLTLDARKKYHVQLKRWRNHRGRFKR